MSLVDGLTDLLLFFDSNPTQLENWLTFSVTQSLFRNTIPDRNHSRLVGIVLGY